MNRYFMGNFSEKRASEDGYITHLSEKYQKNSFLPLFLRGFSPNIAVLASGDANELASAKGFGCVHEMLSIFEENKGETVLIRHSEGNVLCEVFGVHFVPLQRLLNDKKIHEEIKSMEEEIDWMEGKVSEYMNVFSYGMKDMKEEKILKENERDLEKTYENPENMEQSLEISSAFHFYCRLLASFPPSVHESFSHPIACVFAISSHSSKPLESLQHLQLHPPMLPYIDFSYLPACLFLHDDSHDLEKSLQVFETIKQTFGIHSYLIRLSPSDQSLDKSQEAYIRVPKDPWNLSFDTTKDEFYALSQKDVSAIRTFVKELISRSIIPAMEQSIDLWNEQVAASRRGIAGKLLNVSKRYFSTGTARNQSSFYNNSNYNIKTLSYDLSSPEARLRKLADYAFMLRDWKFAQSIYELLKKDFLNDKAWKYYAGVQEMLALCSLFPSYTTKIKVETIDSMLNASLYSYLSESSSPFFALRSVIFASELMFLQSNEAKNNAAKWLIKILETGILGNTINALLIERISYCFGTIRSYGLLSYGSRRKKAALWKILATEAWLTLGKKKLAQQSFLQAMSVYQDTQWNEINAFTATLHDQIYT
ncbi:hypothetical protein PNEG_02933 [Pneumocystis murina B123]|uniref:Uncharacterized protein n=1 Tax=Pneumocystis murina (strain B123) TaxID=1069680 RepID=M7NJJ3_PNEMU|nr:hypothetical protein PNEG_02933 [Pneumocystis murina B123]EMR08763.1 hypothetical protein PNEG_02933 [Pneumocystis murina B123]